MAHVAAQYPGTGHADGIGGGLGSPSVLDVPAYFLGETGTGSTHASSLGRLANSSTSENAKMARKEKTNSRSEGGGGGGGGIKSSNNNSSSLSPPPPLQMQPFYTSVSQEQTPFLHAHDTRYNAAASKGINGDASPSQQPSHFYYAAAQQTQQQLQLQLPGAQQSSHPQHASPYFSGMHAVVGPISPTQPQYQRPHTAITAGAPTPPNSRDASGAFYESFMPSSASTNMPQQQRKASLVESQTESLGDEGTAASGVAANATSAAKRHGDRTPESDLAQCHFTVTTEICLRARNGDRSADVWYPRAPNVMAVMSQLPEPYTNGTTALHFFAAAQHERKRECDSDQAEMHVAPFREQQNQPAPPFYHNYPALAHHVPSHADDDSALSLPPSPRTYESVLHNSDGERRDDGEKNSTKQKTAGRSPPGTLCYHPPPLDDFSHPNPNLRPRTQEERLRYPSDLYTPRWIRDEGAKREGWCSLCEQGQWLQLKTSQYWYHVKGAHGVNYHTGQIYDPPAQLRVFHDTCGSTHGLCGQCGEWVKIVTPRRKRNFASWFRHAQKCQRSQLPAGLFGFAPASTASSATAPTGLGMAPSSFASAHHQSGGGQGVLPFMMGNYLQAPGSSASGPTLSSSGYSTETGIGARLSTGFSDARGGACTRMSRSWVQPFGDSIADSSNMFGDTSSTSNAAVAALSLPPSPRSIAHSAPAPRFTRTQPPSRDSYYAPMSQSGTLSTAQQPQIHSHSQHHQQPSSKYDALPSPRTVRSAPHHINSFYFSALGDTSGNGSNFDYISNTSMEATTNVPPSSSGSNNSATVTVAVADGPGRIYEAEPSAANTTASLTDQLALGISAMHQQQLDQNQQQHNTYLSLAGGSQHTFPLTPRQQQQQQSPYRAKLSHAGTSWLT